MTPRVLSSARIGSRTISSSTILFAMFLWIVLSLTYSSLVAQESTSQQGVRLERTDADYSTQGPGTNVAESRVANCGDALSDALGQSSSGMPCWSDIRTVDHWNTLSLGQSMTVSGDPAATIPGSGRSGFSYTAGALSGLLYQNDTNAQAYAGQAAVSGFLRMRKWQLIVEDGGTVADYRYRGQNFAGLNRVALRASGSAVSRWSWQGSATNSYGNDTLRTAGPLDYRKIGSAETGSTEAPVADVVAYGLHAGNVLDEQEDAKIDFHNSRRTSMGVAVAHTLRNFEDDGVQVQTERARAEVLHSLTQNVALGAYAGASRQTGIAHCSLAGLGAAGLVQIGSRASASFSGALDGASASCGKRVQATADFSMFFRAARRTDVFLSGNRDLSGGVVERAALLNSASAGIRQGFASGASVRFTGAAIYLHDILDNAAHAGTFGEVDGIVPLGRSFLQETTYRHYQVSGLPVPDNRNVVTFTLWWAPKRVEPETLTAHR